VFPVRYELNSYINLLRNSVFKGLTYFKTCESCSFIIIMEVALSSRHLYNSVTADKDNGD
jgi:hypothetical protein